MKLSARKIKTLYIKDAKDLFRNATVLVSVLIPVFFMILYKAIFGGDGKIPQDYLLKMGMVMNLGMVPVMIISTAVAEEKEKNTLRTLMLSNVSGAEFSSS